MATINKTTTTISQLWESLGTFWGQFPDKDLITKFWELYQETVNELYRRKVQVHMSKYMSFISPILTKPNSTYLSIFSGDDKNVVTVSGLNGVETDIYTFSIPTLSGVETGEILTEDVDYAMYEKQYIRFLSAPSFDSANTDVDNRVTLYADEVYRHNPILWEVHASGVGLTVSSLDNEDYLPYNNIASSGNERVFDIADHYKYLIWGLAEMRRRPPTIKSLETGYGISRGVPFAYRPGTVTGVIDNTISILVSGFLTTTDTYVIPSGYTITAVSGQAVEQFSLLVSGIRFHDHVNDLAYIQNLPNVNDFNYTSTVAFTYPSNFNNFSYNATYHDTYVASLMPASLNYQSFAE